MEAMLLDDQHNWLFKIDLIDIIHNAIMSQAMQQVFFGS